MKIKLDYEDEALASLAQHPIIKVKIESVLHDAFEKIESIFKQEFEQEKLETKAREEAEWNEIRKL